MNENSTPAAATATQAPANATAIPPQAPAPKATSKTTPNPNEVLEGMPSFPGMPATGAIAVFEKAFRHVLGGLRNPTSSEIQLGRAILRSVFLNLGAEEKDSRFVYLRVTAAEVSELKLQLEDLQKRLSALEKGSAKTGGSYGR